VKYGKAWESGTNSDLRSYSANVSVPVTDAFDIIGTYGYGKTGRLDSVFGTSGTDLTNYWQRYWFVGVRAKQLFARGERGNSNPYYYDNRTVGSPIVPPIGEAH